MVVVAVMMVVVAVVVYVYACDRVRVNVHLFGLTLLVCVYTLSGGMCARVLGALEWVCAFVFMHTRTCVQHACAVHTALAHHELCYLKLYLYIASQRALYNWCAGISSAVVSRLGVKSSFTDLNLRREKPAVTGSTCRS